MGASTLLSTRKFVSLGRAGTVTLGGMVFTCQAGYEDVLRRELIESGFAPTESGEGWVGVFGRDATGAIPVPDQALEPLCFPHLIWLDAREIRARGVNGAAAAIAEWFLESARGERFEEPWPLLVRAVPGREGLGRRAAAVRTEALARIRRRISRVARLAVDEAPAAGRTRGAFVLFVDFDRVFVARELWSGGQRRMADDPAAPSRSFLKVEEAYGVLGQVPGPGERVVDLGAAPGGWSYSAAKRGARVLAIDNGPLKAGAAASEAIEHRREDAFRFRPAEGEVFDWLFCDLVEEPHHVLRSIVEPWLRGRWCRRFVINLKFGRADPVALLVRARAVAAPHCERLRIRHLYHDREEFTLAGCLGMGQPVGGE